MEGRQIFMALLDRVGSSHCYQTVCLVAFSLLAYLSGSANFFNAFLFYPGSYECPHLDASACKEYVCSLEQAER